jgi:cytochrome P450
MVEAPVVKAPGRRSRFLVDVALDMRRRGFLEFWVNAWRQYGDLAHMQLGPGNVFVVVHPEHIRHISITNRDNYDKLSSYEAVRELLLGNGLVASTGDLWRRQRRLMSPFFTPRGIEAFASIMIDDGRAWLTRWEGKAAAGTPVEMIDEMMLLAASIILKTMFSMESDTDMLEVKNAVETMIRFVSSHEMNPFSLPLWVPTDRNRAYHQARERVHTYINNLIARRRAMPADEWPDDLLSRLMLARDEDTGEAMPDDLLRDESITIFFAGHETTARTLTFTWYALSQNPEVEARLHHEVDSVLGDRTPTLDDLKAMPYTLQVIKETLRLYPPAPLYARDAIGEDVIDGMYIPVGSRMLLMPYCTHRHPDFWDDPERFDPDRWLPEREKERHPYAYHPFASGQRICIGNNFSLLESHILLSMLSRRYRAHLLEGHRPEFEMAGTLYVRNGMPMIIEKRA